MRPQFNLALVPRSQQEEEQELDFRDQRQVWAVLDSQAQASQEHLQAAFLVAAVRRRDSLLLDFLPVVAHLQASRRPVSSLQAVAAFNLHLADSQDGRRASSGMLQNSAPHKPSMTSRRTSASARRCLLSRAPAELKRERVYNKSFGGRPQHNLALAAALGVG